MFECVCVSVCVGDVVCECYVVLLNVVLGVCVFVV